MKIKNLKNQYLFVKTLSAIFLFVAAINNKSYAEITIYYRNINEKINEKGGPEFSGEFRSTNEAGTPVIMDSTNTLLLEREAVINKTLEFETPGTQGWQKLTWTSALDVKSASNCTFFVSENNEIGIRRLSDFEFEIPLLAFYQSNTETSPTPLLELFFDRTDLSQEFKQIYVRYSYPNPLYLDSITFTSPNFYCTWAGNSLDKVPPPKWLQPYNYYLLTIHYKRPADKPFQREFMIFHYGGGLKKKFELLTETYDLPVVKSLQLDAPMGTEILAPCQDFTIKWHGQAAKHPVVLSYSTNGGSSWKPIDTVAGTLSEYVWKVPAELTANGLVKVAQMFNRTENLNLSRGEMAVKAATFNKNAQKVVTVGENGIITEWNLYDVNSPQIITDLQINEDFEYSDVKYINENEFVVLAKSLAGSLLIFCNSGSTNVSKTINLPENFLAKKLLIDEKSRFIAAVPENFSNNSANSNKLQFVSPAGNFICNYVSKFPINDAVISKTHDKIYISSLNNEIKVLSLSNFPNFLEDKSYNFSEHLRVIHNFSVSQDARLISLAGTSPIESSSEREFNNNYIFDDETGKLFRKLVFSQKTSLGSDFNPNGNVSIFANRGENWMEPQIVFTDLTGKLDFDRTTFSDFRPGALHGFEVAESGNSLIEYSAGKKNCYVVNFSLPESDTNEIFFTIENPILRLTEINMDTLILGTENSYTFTQSVCNIGRVPAIFQNVKFKNSKHLQLKNYNLPDTLEVGECAFFEVVALPLDTGNIGDELIFSACGTDFVENFNFYSKNRNLLALIPQPLDFSEVCVNENVSKKIALFRNLDTVPLLVNHANFLINQHFKLVYSPADTMLQPLEEYVVEVMFSPQSSGILSDTIAIFHSNQAAVTPFYTVQGTGIGTFLATSHKRLYFIPEIKVREITITNTGTAGLYVDSISIDPPGLYNVLTPLPLNLAAGETAKISVEFITEKPEKAKLEFAAKPCVVSGIIELGAYSDNVTLTIPDIYADPRDTNVSVPILFHSNENVAYQGIRDFSAKIAINPRIFYPLSISSKYGLASIEQNEIVDDKRIISVRISGDFTDYQDTLFELRGAAGLCETDISDLTFANNSDYFGEAVDVNVNFATFNLINLCEDRRILRNKLNILSLSPNPADLEINLKYVATENIFDEVTVSIFNSYGELVLKKIAAKNITAGTYELKLPIYSLSVGSYTLQFNYENSRTIYHFSVVR